jgi:hypothetical protein
MAAYRFGDVVLGPDSPDFHAVVAQAYANKVRPTCVCRDPDGPPMYIAHLGDQYLIKRMPYSGVSHSPDCDSFEAPGELSGRGNLDGSAIQRADNGLVSLKFDFSLSHHGSPSARGAPTEKTSVTSNGNKLSLRGLLHYLWDEAELTKWVPGFAGKRNWFVLRRRLLAETEGKEAKKSSLSSIIYVPEFYDQERKLDIRQRRLAHLAKISGTNGKRMMVVIGEYENISEGRSDFSLLHIKHLPDFPLRMTANLRKDFDKMFSKVVGLYEFIQDSHLMVIATFSMDISGTPEIGEISVMLTTPNWIPIENLYDNELVELLTEKKRSFLRVLRYNLSKKDPIASAILTDTAPEAYGLYIVLGDLDSDGPPKEAMQEFIENVHYPAWIWEPSSGVPPEFPPRGIAKKSNTATVLAAKNTEIPARRIEPHGGTVESRAVEPERIPALASIATQEAISTAGSQTK